VIAICLTLPGCSVGIISNLVTATASSTGAYYDYKTAQKAEPVIVVPKLRDYGTAVQHAAADEVDTLAPPCPRDIVTPGCSALARMIIDYGVLRDQIRAAKADD